MKILDLVTATRSFRRFDETRKVELSQLRYMVEVARLTAAARNLQPLKYITITNPTICNQLVEATGWANALPEARPAEGERPTGFILVLNDKSIAPNSLWDQGIVSYTMMMAATEMELGGCIIATIYRDKLPDLSIPEGMEPVLALAIGYTTEQVEIVEVRDNAVGYYRDENRVHFVPKRSIEEILISEIE